MILRTLIQRLASRPLVLLEVTVISLVVAVLSFAQPVFVIQVLNRYVAFGVDSTLWTLAAGAAVAIVFELLFRKARLLLVRAANAPHDRRLSERAFDLLSTLETGAMGAMTTSERRRIMGSVDAVTQAFRPATVANLLDVPFGLVFIVAVWLLNPLLGAITAAGFTFGLILAAQAGWSTGRTHAQTAETGLLRSGLINAVVLSPDTVRAFNGAPRMGKAWAEFDTRFRRLQGALGLSQGQVQALGQTLVAITGISVVAVGAVEVVAQRLDVGAMIGANILAARALQPVLRLSGSVFELVRARHGFAVLGRVQTLARERSGGGTLANYAGRVTLDDVAFAWPGAAGPLFESVSLDLAPGSVLVVTGKNGAGKTTFARVLAGLLAPTRGSIRVDGVELRQLDPAWWRRQLVFLPQEPVFLPGNVRDAISALNPDIDEAALNRLIETAGLRTFVAGLPDGLMTPITDGRRDLAVGIRRRLALARALACDGRVAILDEPLEAMDAEGRQIMTDVVRALSAFGRTIIALSHEPTLFSGRHRVLDLNEKPVPVVRDHHGDPAETPARKGGEA